MQAMAAETFIGNMRGPVIEAPPGFPWAGNLFPFPAHAGDPPGTSITGPAFFSPTRPARALPQRVLMTSPLVYRTALTSNHLYDFIR